MINFQAFSEELANILMEKQAAMPVKAMRSWGDNLRKLRKGVGSGSGLNFTPGAGAIKLKTPKFKQAGIGSMTNVQKALAAAPKGKPKFPVRAPKPVAGPGPSIPGFSPKQTSQMAASNDFSRVWSAERPMR